MSIEISKQCRLDSMKNVNYYCPRCGNIKIMEYDEEFECTKCTDTYGKPLAFNKEIFNEIEDKTNILSVQELLGILGDDEIREGIKKTLTDKD